MRNLLGYLVAVVTLVALPASSVMSQEKTLHARDGAKKAAIVCPAEDFAKFAQVFSNSVSTQRDFTKYPLQKQWVDSSAEPEPKTLRKSLSVNQVVFPVIPPVETRNAQGLKLDIHKKGNNRGEITLTKPDTGYQVSYHFRKNDCWVLTKIEDWSI